MLDDVHAAIIHMADKKCSTEKYSISALARLSGLDRATVRKHLEGVEPVEVKSKEKIYALEDALPALIKGRSAEFDEARLKKIKAEASLKEHDLAVERAEFVAVKDVETERVKECQWLFNRLVSQLPREISTQLYNAESPAHIAEILKHDLGRVLNEWREL